MEILHKWFYVYPQMGKTNLHKISLTNDVTYSHLMKIRDMLISKGLLKTVKSGRTLELDYTTKGLILRTMVIELMLVLGEPKKQSEDEQK